MTAVQVSAGRGWIWIVEGWQLFAKAPGIWIVMLLIYFAASVVLSLIPFIGIMAHALLNPLLIGGMLHGAAALARSEQLEIAFLFQGFKEQERMGSLVVLGGISVAGYMLIAVVILVMVGGSMATGIILNQSEITLTPEAIEGFFLGAGIVTGLLVLTIGLLITMALFYGVALVMLAGQNAWPAVQDSITACWINALPLLVFGLIYLVLIFLAVIPFGLGLLILFPVTVCAVYASYQEVFPGAKPRVSI